jgi:hypothetical protein
MLGLQSSATVVHHRDYAGRVSTLRSVERLLLFLRVVRRENDLVSARWENLPFESSNSSAANSPMPQPSM